MGQITIKFGEDDHKKIEEIAKKEHLRPTTLCRKVILDFVYGSGDRLPPNDRY